MTKEELGKAAADFEDRLLEFANEACDFNSCEGTAVAMAAAEGFLGFVLAVILKNVGDDRKFALFMKTLHSVARATEAYSLILSDDDEDETAEAVGRRDH